jgi:hypothetical protein
MNRGPAFGSVAPPWKIPPKPCPRTQYAMFSTTAAAKNFFGCQSSATATPIAIEPTARMTAIGRPLPLEP